VSDQLRERVVAAVGDQYDIESEIGRGGMSIVYRALDRRLRRHVAIKVLPPEFAFDPAVRERFRREAQTAAQLNHPNIIPIHSVDEKEGIAYFAMTLCDGDSLAQQLARRARPPIDEVRRVVCEVADALAYAHLRGVVHRDIKPDNILLDRESGRALVTDFGIARAAEAGSRLTVTGIAVGTPAYMSPEQALGEHEIDGRSDIYSLGVVGYQMLTGVTPFVANNTPSMLMKHVSELPAPISRHRRDAPPDLTAAIERALSKRPDDRWQTAGELRDVLAGRNAPLFAAGSRGTARSVREQPPPPSQLPAPPMSRRDLKRARRAELRAARQGLRDDELSVAERARRIRHRLVSYMGAGSVLFAINFSVQGDPWFLIPTAVMAADVLRRFGGLWADGIPMSEVFRRPSPADRLEARRAAEYASIADPDPYASHRELDAPPLDSRPLEQGARGNQAGSLAPIDSAPGRNSAGSISGLPRPPRALSAREVREQLRAEAQMRVDVEDDRRVWGRATSLQRRFQKYRQQALITASSTLLSTGALMATMADTDLFPLLAVSLAPLILSVVGFARKTISLRRDDVDPGDVLSKPLDVLVREYDPAALLGQVARDAAPGSGMIGSPYMEAVRRATSDRTAILEAVRKMSKTDRRMLPDVVPTVNALVERIASLAPTLHRLDADLQPTSVDRLNERIADVERQAPLTPEAERKLALLQRQRSSVEDLMKRRDTLLGQLESAGLLLQNLKLDLIKVQSAGVNASVQGVNNATQEARALSTEIGYVLGAADEIRGM
jgi:serine/threonine-protein kinase